MESTAKLLETIQRTLVVGKSERNNYGNYNYRTAEGILKAVKPLLTDAYINISDEIVEVAGRLFLKAKVEFRGSDSMVITSTGWAELDHHKGMSSEQCTGSASSYARKYALCGLFAIDDSKGDPDTMDNTNAGVDGIRRAAALCKDKDALLQLWNGLQGWQNDESVKQIFTQRKAEL